MSLPDIEAPVMVGHCVVTGRRFRAYAHAHVGGRYKGWICANTQRRLTPQTVLHEFAHLLTPGGHTDRWRKTLVALGGTLDAVNDCRDWHKRVTKGWRYRGEYPPHSPKCPCGRPDSTERGR